MQAHARLLASEQVTQQDALVAVMLVDASMGEAALCGGDPMLDVAAEGSGRDAESRLLALLQNRLNRGT